jgi:membrane-associated HD superfamily phosphohydrolase
MRCVREAIAEIGAAAPADMGKVMKAMMPKIQGRAAGDQRWQAVQQESLAVLEQVMRNTIREGSVREAQRSIPTLISFTLPQDQALTVTSLVTPFVVPNSLYSEDLTFAARLEARESVEPVVRTFIAGEAIVRRGQIISPAAYEALQQYRLIEVPDNYRSMLATIALVTLNFGFTAMYLAKRKKFISENIRGLALTAAAFLIFLYFARLIIPNRTVLPYLFPLQAFGLTVSSLFSIELGLMLSLVLEHPRGLWTAQQPGFDRFLYPFQHGRHSHFGKRPAHWQLLLGRHRYRRGRIDRHPRIPPG